VAWLRAVPEEDGLPSAEELAALPHEELAARLERQLARDSSSSLRPPSSDDPYRKKQEPGEYRRLVACLQERQVARVGGDAGAVDAQHRPDVNWTGIAYQWHLPYKFILFHELSRFEVKL